ncbi:protein adenylyltransferase SelO [Microvirga arsenatis]|uniref:Protein nucleotidyltransferase YdiU n=1 Tax=Microvirga arsenatis TaxID=2692265 RepID=A0ABW9YVQ4_9HYPH|nr:YdiU family protein [Microvirga arsenatis]NBJ10857.1 YdiU family protein [Microvirga arsenatis]NBJ24245.1 YdiU family protein [Microvirga arsenatis]
MPVSAAYSPSAKHQDLGPDFYDIVQAARFPQHVLRYRNQRWAARVGLDSLTDEEWIDHFGRFTPLPGSLEQPLALRYHGHQFRTYNPYLGDGRGFLFAQLRDAKDGRLLDLGTKGSGQTPWSRHADGRLTLKGGVREILATEMLEALGVETSKSFSLIETGEELERGDEPSPTRSSVLVRLSHSHVRIGTFQRFLYLSESHNISRLLDYTIQTYMPEAWREEEPARAAAFLEEVCRRVACMGAQWMAAGFVHGVLNTDNINVTGESFDYGPWRFLPYYEPGFTAAYFDETGLYAFGRQPDTLLWNLFRLAECLLPLAEQSALEQALSAFEPALHRAFADAILRRLGLQSESFERDGALAKALWTFLHETKAPFEQVFFDWYGGEASAGRAAHSPAADHYAQTPFQAVRAAFQSFAPAPGIKLDHPYFARPVPCTMLIDEVEAVWSPIAMDDDWSSFQSKIMEIRVMAEAYETGPEI